MKEGVNIYGRVSVFVFVIVSVCDCRCLWLLIYFVSFGDDGSDEPFSPCSTTSTRTMNVIHYNSFRKERYSR